MSFAQSLGERLRAIDLNDYAAGAALSVGTRPYRGAANSSTLYPYLTSVEDPTLTDHALVIRNGAFGVRRVTAPGLEIGLLAHVETLSYGTDPAPELESLEPPGWTVELGPSLGWRRGPVQPDLSVRKGLLGGHSGWVGELSLSLPRRLDRGYLVPYVALVQQDEDFVSHYYGVRPRVGGPVGGGYVPDEALNHRLGVRAAYRLTDLWVLTGSLRVDWLDESITASPVVDQDRMAAVTVGVAYNRSVFREREAAESRSEPGPRFEFSALAVDARLDTRINLKLAAAGGLSAVDLEDELEVPDSATLYRGDVVIRFAGAHRLELGYSELSRTGSAALPAAATPAAPQEARLRSRFPRLAYGYSFLRDEQKEAGVTLGLQWPSLRTELAGAFAGPERTRVVASSPGYSLGAFASVALRRRFSARARLEFGGLDFDRYRGRLLDLNVAAGWAPSPGLRFLAGYAWHRVRLEGLTPDFAGSSDQQYSGPFAGLSLSF